MARASTILIIRHAEKPDQDGAGPGLTADGLKNKSSLSLRGWQRAGAWAALFGSGLAGSDYPAPDAIYAASAEQARRGKPRLRQLQTIQPLAERLGIRPVLDYGKGDEEAMASAILNREGVVLISWEYVLIVESLLPALLGGQHPPECPTEWDPARFDVVLRLDRAGAEAPWRFRQCFPCLLAGDSTVPLR